jgi:DNA-binding PadR family transcriptional regulator
MHGYEMIQELDERTSGVWRPSPGAVYPALQLLEDQGLVTAVEADGKRRYQLTDAGRAEVPEKAPWDDVTSGIDPVQFKLRDAIGDIALAATQVARAGTPSNVRRQPTCSLAHRGLYAILAQSPSRRPAARRSQRANAEVGGG